MKPSQEKKKVDLAPKVKNERGENLYTRIVWVLLQSLVAFQGFRLFKQNENITASIGIQDQLYDNLKGKPIKEFKYVDLDAVVPDAWELVAPFNFPGMTGYCNCNGQYSASCDPTKEDQKECIKILPEDKRLMNNWRESKLIFRRFKKKEIEYVRKNKDGKVHCKEGFKKCTPIHCVKDYVQCPITHFWLNLGKKTYVKKGNDVEVIDLGKDSLVVERKSDSEKIVNGFHLGKFFLLINIRAKRYALL